MSEEHKKRISESKKGHSCSKSGSEHYNAKAVYLYNSEQVLIDYFGSRKECCEWFVEQGLSNKPQCLKPVISRNIDTHKLYKGFLFYSYNILDQKEVF